MQSVILILTLVFGIVWMFNPYMASRWRTDVERWTTRERSYGHPFYWKMRYADKDSAYDHDADPGCSSSGVSCGNRSCKSMHNNLYNRPTKIIRRVKNIIYVE